MARPAPFQSWDSIGGYSRTALWEMSAPHPWVTVAVTWEAWIASGTSTPLHAVLVSGAWSRVVGALRVAGLASHSATDSLLGHTARHLERLGFTPESVRVVLAQPEAVVALARR